jgi:hypothetical protein
LHRVLVAVDDSETSKNAVSNIFSSMWPDNTSFLLLNVVKRGSGGFSSNRNRTGLPFWTSDRAECLKQLHSLVHSFSDRLAGAAVRHSIGYAIEEGQPDDVIVRTARQWGAELIVVGSSGPTGITKRILGSTAQSVLMNADCSVQVVRIDLVHSPRVMSAFHSSFQKPSIGLFQENSN